MLKSLHALQRRYLTCTIIINFLIIVSVQFLGETDTCGHRNCFAYSQVNRWSLRNLSSAPLDHRTRLARIHLVHLVCNLSHSLVESLGHVLTDRSRLIVHLLIKPLLLLIASITLALDFEYSTLAGT